MTATNLALVLAAGAALCACEARIGNDAPPVEANASAAGKAEDGRVTVSAPGFNMSINIPEGMRGHENTDSDLLYPGATIGGVHVQARPDNARGESGGEVELTFTTGDAPDRVVTWYRDSARNESFVVQSAGRDGNGFVLSGVARDDNKPFTLHLSPHAGGGSEGRLLISDRD